MNIAIVDDEKIELETAETFLRLYIKKFWAKYESLINIETFYQCRRLFLPEILSNRNSRRAYERFCRFNRLQFQ